jgi:RNA polymerase sigma factor (sigma-70 family)
MPDSSVKDPVAEAFEAERGRLLAVAHRMLGSHADAEDAVQEAWLRLSRQDAAAIDNLAGWLTTVVGRISLDVLRSRKARPEASYDDRLPELVVAVDDGPAPEDDVALGDSVGLALLVVLETLRPGERLAFVLHDLFAVPFDEIAPIVGRSPTAARQLASRARRRVRRQAAVPDLDPTRQRELVDAFLAAAQQGDFSALLEVLDPEVVLHADSGGVAAGAITVVRGAAAVAEGALAFSGRARFARPVLVNGAAGVLVSAHGRPLAVMGFTVAGGRIVEIDVIADPDRLHHLDLTALDA